MEQAPSPQCPNLRRDQVSLGVVSPAGKEKVELHLQQAQDDFADLCQHFSNTEVTADTTGLGFLVPPWPSAVPTALLVPWGVCFILLA